MSSLLSNGDVSSRVNGRYEGLNVTTNDGIKHLSYTKLGHPGVLEADGRTCLNIHRCSEGPEAGRWTTTFEGLPDNNRINHIFVNTDVKGLIPPEAGWYEKSGSYSSLSLTSIGLDVAELKTGLYQNEVTRELFDLAATDQQLALWNCFQ